MPIVPHDARLTLFVRRGLSRFGHLVAPIAGVKHRMKTKSSLSALLPTLLLSALAVGCGGSTVETDPDGDPTHTGGTGGGSGGGGSGGVGGEGSGGVPAIPIEKTSKVDLLFVIDNSIGMADKQQVLKEAVPNLLRGLAVPDCVHQAQTVVPRAGDGSCPAGSTPRFAPVSDLHVAAITSSLGSHGGEVCASTTPTVDYPNDMAHLIPSVRPDVPQSDPAGFLSWSGGGQDMDQLLADAQAQIVAAGERGCGYEATLESFYRFLIDPHPPQAIFKDPGTGTNARSAEDDAVLLAQRSAFLRSDSAVMIVVLSDENDCSILDVGNGWASSSPNFQFKPASSICATKPDDKCCYSCFGSPPEGCAADPVCADPNARVPAQNDRGNVRCAQQKKRFGLELLWPTERYIAGLTQAEVVDSWDPAAPTVPNPLFPVVDGSRRSPSLVFFMGIIGVPWQDLVVQEQPRFMSAAELAQNGTWDVILGNTGQGVLPTDAHMIESVQPRPGLADYSAPWGDPIHGNDFDNSKTFAPDGSTPANDDLQYACVFPLTDPIDCTIEENKNRCNCFEPADLEKISPLCQNGAGAPQENTQYFAKAYPGTRFLEVMKGIGDSAVVTSICPQNAIFADPTDHASGYNPNMAAAISALAPVLQ